jgi:hypothetical protein
MDFNTVSLLKFRTVCTFKNRNTTHPALQNNVHVLSSISPLVDSVPAVQLGLAHPACQVAYCFLVETLWPGNKKI